MLTNKVVKITTNLTNTFLRFRSIVISIACLAIFNILYKVRFTSEGVVSAFNLWNPTWLLFGPLLYLAYISLHKNGQFQRKHLLHLLPAFVFSLFYIITLWHNHYPDPWSDPVFICYQNSFFIISFSLFIYARAVCIRIKRKIVESASELLFILGVTFILIAILYGMMYLCWGVFDIDMGVDYRLLTYGLLLVATLFILRYMLTKDSLNERAANGVTDRNYANSTLNEKQAHVYISMIKSYFEESEPFLRSDLSLEVLSKELDLPKHYFSQLFNVYIGKSFYNFVADYRINFAIEKMQAGVGQLKIETLAYECGFNSKTSFNRYFKSITGYTPLEYVQKEIGPGGQSSDFAVS